MAFAVLMAGFLHVNVSPEVGTYYLLRDQLNSEILLAYVHKYQKNWESSLLHSILSSEHQFVRSLARQVLVYHLLYERKPKFRDEKRRNSNPLMNGNTKTLGILGRT